MDLPCVLACGSWEAEGTTPRELSVRSKFVAGIFDPRFGRTLHDVLDDGRFRAEFVHPEVTSDAGWAACCAAFFHPRPLPRVDARYWPLIVSFADYIGDADYLRDELAARAGEAFSEIPLASFPREELLGLARDPHPLSEELLGSIGGEGGGGTREEHERLPGIWKGAFSELSAEAVVRLYRLWARRMRERGWETASYLDVFEEGELIEKLREAHPGARVVATEREFARNLSAGTGHVWLEERQPWMPGRAFVAGGAVTSAACGLFPADGDLDVWIQDPYWFRLAGDGWDGRDSYEGRAFVTSRPGASLSEDFPFPRFAPVLQGIMDRSRLRVRSYERVTHRDYVDHAIAGYDVEFAGDRAKKFQFLCDAGNVPADTAARFDLDCVRAWFAPGSRKLFAHFDALESWFSRKTSWRRRPCESRLLKYRARGFSIGGHSDRLLGIVARLQPTPWIFEAGEGVHRSLAMDRGGHATVVVGDGESMTAALSRAKEACPTRDSILHPGPCCHRKTTFSLEIHPRLYFEDVRVFLSPEMPGGGYRVSLAMDAGDHAALRAIHEEIMRHVLEKANAELASERAHGSCHHAAHDWLPEGWQKGTDEFEDGSEYLRSPTLLSAFVFRWADAGGREAFERALAERIERRADVVVTLRSGVVDKPDMKIRLTAHLAEMKFLSSKRKRDE